MLLTLRSRNLSNSLAALQHRSIYKHVDRNTYISLLQHCLRNRSLLETKIIHAHMIQTGFIHKYVFLTNTIIHIYCKCHCLADASKLLHQMPRSDVVSWSFVIAHYANSENPSRSLNLFYEMKKGGIETNEYTLSSVAKACGRSGALEEGFGICQEIKDRNFMGNVVVGSAVVDMFIKLGQIECARHVFDEMPVRNVVTWNTMIGGYGDCGNVEEAVALFQKMPTKSLVSWNTMIRVFGQNGLADRAEAFFHEMDRHDLVSYNSFIALHVENGRIDEARKIFDSMPKKDKISWTQMIEGYTELGMMDDAEALFEQMPEKDSVSWNVMVQGYLQNGLLDKALDAFSKIPVKTLVSWTAMIGGYAQNGFSVKALKFFRDMVAQGLSPNCEACASVLLACAGSGALEFGREVHCYLITHGLWEYILAGSALIDMYSKCGSIEDACKVFEGTPRKDIVLWNALIAGLSIHGLHSKASEFFQDMHYHGFCPDHFTFMGMLHACCQAGMVREASRYFDCMIRAHGILPGLEHYGCMVDALGRRGYLKEALAIIIKINLRAEISFLWSSLLHACQTQGDAELAEFAGKKLLELGSRDAVSL